MNISTAYVHTMTSLCNLKQKPLCTNNINKDSQQHPSESERRRSNSHCGGVGDMEQKKREQKATRRDGNISEGFTFLRRLMKRCLVSLLFYGIFVPKTRSNLSEFRFQVPALHSQCCRSRRRCCCLHSPTSLISTVSKRRRVDMMASRSICCLL